MKTCACGRVYDRNGWLRLPAVGELQEIEACDPSPGDDGAAMLLESRNCSCGSTLVVDLLSPPWAETAVA